MIWFNFSFWVPSHIFLCVDNICDNLLLRRLVFPGLDLWIPNALNFRFLDLPTFAKQSSFEKSLSQIKLLAISQGLWSQVLIELWFFNHFYRKYSLLQCSCTAFAAASNICWIISFPRLFVRLDGSIPGIFTIKMGRVSVFYGQTNPYKALVK